MDKELGNYNKLKKYLFDSTGRMFTTGLFKETQTATSSLTPPFTLEAWHKVYVEAKDPTEYKAAMMIIGNYAHWVALRKNQVLAAIFDEWKLEVEVLLRSEAVALLIDQSKEKGGTQAARWLAEGSFNPKDKRDKGAKKREEEVLDRIAVRVEEDFNRITGIKSGELNAKNN